MSKPLNIIFAGTPDFAAKHLAALLNANHNIVAVYCPPDKPSGRGKKLTPCATKALALAHDIVVEQPVNFKDPIDQQKLASYNADVMVVVAYGLLLPQIILQTPRLGCINVHGSLLPKWRGAAPIQRSLEAGDGQTGVTIMQMDLGLDTGNMILKSVCDISQTDTSASLYEKLALLGPEALLQTLAMMQQDGYSNEVQDNKLSSYATKLDKTEAELDWQLTAQQLDRKIRAYNPWPIAQFTFTEPQTKKAHKIRIWQASLIANNENHPAGMIISTGKDGILVATGKGGKKGQEEQNALLLQVLQLPGKKALPVSDILNGRADWFIAGQKIFGLI